jgi:predicted RNA-binding Zn-ribbon protein involved in translation (DUF1610 family)
MILLVIVQLETQYLGGEDLFNRMSYLDKVHLDKTSKKYLCPQCGKKTLVVYVNAETKIPVNEYVFGRCDRESNCEYHVKPKLDTQGKSTNDAQVVAIFPNEEEQLKKLHKQPSPLHTFLASKGIPHQHLYDDGVLEMAGLTAYVFRNLKGKLCNIKWFKYKPDGHRDKDHESKSLKQPERKNQYIEEKYLMPLFGEHQLDPDKKRICCVVESEKTKTICKFFYPEYDWVSCGSASGLSDGTEGTADKITPLKGRTVYWVCDADKAARGKLMIIDKTGKEEFVWCSSVRNGMKYVDNFHVVDLWPDRNDGWDLGDELLEHAEDILSGKKEKPKLEPTFSKKQQDPRFKSYIPPQQEPIKEDWTHGVQPGDPCHVKELSNIFAWMRGFVSGWYGWSNDGKGTFFNFMAILKARKDNWKILAMKQEDMSSHMRGNSVEIDANRIYTNLVWMITGITPYKHFAQKHNRELLEWDKYMECLEWVKQHYFVVYPRDRRFKNVIDEFKFFYEHFGIDIFLIDPFKSLILPDSERGDERLTKVFVETKEFALETNSCFNYISHPKSLDEVKEKTGDRKGAYKVVNQFMQLGGSAWDINMDSQYSIYRNNRHTDPNDPNVWFYNLKQREAEIVGVNKGDFKNIVYDFYRKQYYFNGVSPMDGSLSTFQPTPYTPPPKPKAPSSNKKKNDGLPFPKDWSAPELSDTDVPPWD